MKPNSIVEESFSALLFALFLITLLQWMSKSLKDVNLLTTDQLLLGMGVSLMSPLIYRTARLLISNLQIEVKKPRKKLEIVKATNEINKEIKDPTFSDIKEKVESIIPAVQGIEEKSKETGEKLSHSSSSRKEEINISNQNINVNEEQKESISNESIESSFTQPFDELKLTEEEVQLLKGLRERLRILNSKLYS